jgi:hypothetical protein
MVKKISVDFATLGLPLTGWVARITETPELKLACGSVRFARLGALPHKLILPECVPVVQEV